jgi:hypothetical protein
LGSWARNDTPADNLSDLDLLVIVSDPSVFLSEASWLLTFGEPCLTFVEPTAIGNFCERRVLFRDGRDIDFSLVPVAAIQQMIGQQIPARCNHSSAESSLLTSEETDLAAPALSNVLFENVPIHREEGSENWRFFPLNFILEICSSEHSDAFISPEARLQRAHD